MRLRDTDDDFDLALEEIQKETPTEEEPYVESQEDRQAYLDQLRAQIKSGSYNPSIGSISVNIARTLSKD